MNLPAKIQTYIVEYEIGDETKYDKVLADTYVSAVVQFAKLKIKKALYPVFIPMGKIISHEDFLKYIKEQS